MDSGVVKRYAKQVNIGLVFAIVLCVVLSTTSTPWVAICVILVCIKYSFDVYFDCGIVKLLHTFRKVTPDGVSRTIEAFDKEED